ncbi:MAG: hypothetical protein KatS3mg102_0894 [Planctomycetota bacterium]|nr:MAG: hypothetical protein KatS3mg102_0894 [Planctomycetota bacterium]
MRAASTIQAVTRVALVPLVLVAAGARAYAQPEGGAGAAERPAAGSEQAAERPGLPPAGLRGRVIQALAPLAVHLPSERPLRAAVLPIVGPQRQETGIGRYVAQAAEGWLQEHGVRVVPREFLQALRRADLRSRFGASGKSGAELAAQLLGLEVVLAGAVRELEGELELSVQLLAAGTGRSLGATAARLPRDAEAAALLADQTPTAPGAEPTAEPNLVLDCAVMLMRQTTGGYEPPVRWDGEQQLRTGDLIQIVIRPQQPCHLLVVAFESDGAHRVIYPAPPPGQGLAVRAAQLAAGQTVRLPLHERDAWFRLEPPAGRETIYIVAEAQAAAAERLERAARRLAELEARLRRLEEQAAAARDGAATSAASAYERAMREAIEQELLGELAGLRHRMRSELESNVDQVALFNQLRRALQTLAEERPEVRLRKLSREPVLGDEVEVVGQGGRAMLRPGRLVGVDRIYAAFTIEHRDR